MATISGVVMKDIAPVEGAKVYLLCGGEVVASAVTDENGAYSCDDLDANKKYHAIVEYSEEIEGETVHYSAKSLPHLTPVGPSIIYLYNEGEGAENWHGGVKKSDHIEVEAPGATDEIDDSTNYNKYVDLTNINYVAIEYLKGEDYDEYNCCSLVVGPKEVMLPYVAQKTVVKLDVSDLSGEHDIGVYSYQYEYTSNPIWVYKVWLE